MPNKLRSFSSCSAGKLQSHNKMEYKSRFALRHQPVWFVSGVSVPWFSVSSNQCLHQLQHPISRWLLDGSGVGSHWRKKNTHTKKPVRFLLSLFALILLISALGALLYCSHKLFSKYTANISVTTKPGYFYYFYYYFLIIILVNFI